MLTPLLPTRLLLPLLLLSLAMLAPEMTQGEEAVDPAKLEFFERRIRPLLAGKCFNCHSADNKAAGGLRVDDRNGLLEGGKRGAAVVPGEPSTSLILKAVRHEAGAPRMPPEGGLETEEIADLERWITEGAVWPAVELSEGQGGWNADYEALRREHWAFRPVSPAATPTVSDVAWPRDDVDRFVLASLESKALAPVADADRAALLRRLTADLTGLLPTPEQADAFVGDGAPGALESVVDALLASPAFGERWGRHWLDIARFGESTGSARNLPYPHAWRYRDWVIDAVNADLSYDRFLVEQIAGDLLPAADPAARERQLIATGFLAIGVKDVNQRFKVRFVMDNVDEQIDTMSRGILGLTVSCARCHDHKFDPVPATDYYALAGILTSTEQCAGVRNKMGGAGLDYYDASMLVVLAPADEGTAAKIAIAKAEVEAAKAAFEQIRGKPEGLAKGENGRPIQQGYRQRWNRAQQEFERLSDPARTGKVAMGLRDAEKIGDTEIRVRGEAEQLGPVVPRGFPSAVEVPGAEPIDPAASGRLQLARWLAHSHNPLTARVYVNRVWQRLFGTGLVDTVDNFGVTGNAPSHPELLDRLAADFVADGWSTKRLVRRLVLSRTYGLSASSQERALAIDPANRLLWRHSPRRLDAEEIRDTMLAIAGRLDRSRPAEGPSRQLEVRELRNNGREIASILSFAKASAHRSVYLPLLRTVVPGALEAFDFADQGQVTGQRESTTVPAQALYLLNDPFVAKQSLVVAETLLDRPTGDDRERIASAFRLVLGRLPTSPEIDDVLAFLAAFEAQAPATPAPVAEAPVETVVTAPSAPDPNLDPDQVEQDSEKVVEELARPRDARSAAFAAFVQAMLASAEFRYLP